MKNNINAFTLVELIVVVTIIAVLSSVGFVAYTWYIDGVRDANRITQLSDLQDWMQLYTVTSRLPLPDNSINITANGETYAYQWSLSEDIVSLIGYQEWGKDIENDIYPVYMLWENRRDFQLMTFLSEPDQIGLIPQTYAEISDFSILFPKTIWSPLGILIDIPTKQPLHFLSPISLAWEYDVVNDTRQVRAYKDSNTFIDSIDWLLSTLIPNQSCKRILEMWKSSGSKEYTINPTGTQDIRVYCDMEIDGGGWIRLIYEDYESPASGWSWSNDITSCGEFGNILWGFNLLSGVFNSKNFIIDEYFHTELMISMDYIKIDSWDNEDAIIRIDWETLFQKEYSSRDWTQVCGSNNANWFEEKEFISIIIPHDTNSVNVSIGSTLNSQPTDESYGHDNLEIFIR